jgi:8-oxo-dGTP pyrophosphatase MutT (NUDIX family)/glyoxylase-like metal-dependent hydrolase (beta-lactamase superfamily II)
VLLRPGPGDGPEVLLTHRPATMAFGPGIHVFPGGALDPGDDADGTLARRSALDAAGCAAAWAGDLAPGPALAHAIAAVRELWEEAGVLLATAGNGSRPAPRVVAAAAAAREDLASLADRLDLRLATDRLVPLSRWVTPPTPDTTRRFDVRFFVADLPPGGEVAIDAREVAAHDWIGAGEAQRRFAAGEIELWSPTSVTLRQLDGARDADAVRRDLSPLAPAAPPAVTRIGDGLRRARLGAGGGIPGVRVDAWLVGRRRVVVVDPGDPTGAGLDAILGAATADGRRLAGVVVTSAAPDHVADAVGLALVAGVPLRASAAAAARIRDGCTELADGDWIRDGDVALRVRTVPGDRDGSVVLEAPELGVVLTGDLWSNGPSRGAGLAEAAAGRAAGEAALAAIPGRRLPAHGP